jgi:hypothetical protein
VERLVPDLIELSTRHNFALWLARAEILGGWARSTAGSTAKGLARLRSHQHRQAGKINFTCGTRGSNLQRISLSKSESVEAYKVDP